MSVLTGRSAAAAFLCYHSVARGGPPFLSLPPECFERHLALLRRRGWGTGTSDDLRALVDGRRPDRPLAFLTFDDGFVDNHEHVLPLLRGYGMRAMVFVLPPLLETGAALDWPEVAARRRAHPEVMRSMTWAMAEALAEAGTEIGSHTLTHPHLPALEGDALAQELLDARRRVAERMGRCDVLAYPFGHWSAPVAHAAARAGYAFAFTMPRRGQRGAHALAIPRIAIDHRDDERRFALKLSAPVRALLLSPLKGMRAPTRALR
jgi:peptidoglycan/xylan/chitin deacetylase (PgdA/CDA1 family)